MKFHKYNLVADLFIASCSEGVGEGVLEISRPTTTELSDAFNAVVENMINAQDVASGREMVLGRMVVNESTYQLGIKSSAQTSIPLYKNSTRVTRAVWI